MMQVFYFNCLIKNFKEMDLTKLQADVDAAQSKVDADNATLATDQQALQVAKDALQFGSTINILEGLSADQVTSLNETLASDPDNANGIVLTLPNAAGTQA
jgi:hypothetical protein